MPQDTQGFQMPADFSPVKEVEQLKSQPELSFGQKLVGLTFNPSGDDKVARAKQLCAELADLVSDHYHQPKEVSTLESLLYHHTIGEILNAQMNVVKVLTLKY
jgi:hypothetical protein